MLDELDCPNCAAQIETALSRLPGVLYAEINLIRQQLTIAADDSFSGDIYGEAVRTVKRFEPEVDVIDTRKYIHNHKRNYPVGKGCHIPFYRQKHT